MATFCAEGTGAVASAAAIVTDPGVTLRLDSPYEPSAPCSVTAHSAPVGMPSIRAVYWFAALSVTAAAAPRATGTPSTVHETSAWKLVGAYCAAAPVTVFAIGSGPPVRMPPALIGSCGPAGCEPDT